jgi:hypothetical protein
MPPNLENINNYINLRSQEDSIIKSDRVIPLLAKSDESSGYNVKNTSRYLKEKETIATVPYNVRYMEATNEARTAEFFTKQKLITSANVNDNFFMEVERCCKIIIDKIKELNEK